MLKCFSNLTFDLNDERRALLDQTARPRHGLYFASVVAIFRRFSHVGEGVRSRDLDVVLVDGVLQCVGGDPVRDVHGDVAGQLEAVALEHIFPLQAEPRLGEELCGFKGSRAQVKCPRRFEAKRNAFDLGSRGNKK